MENSEITKENKQSDPSVATIIFSSILLLLIPISLYFLYQYTFSSIIIKSDCENIEGGALCNLSHNSEKMEKVVACLKIKRICTNGISSSAKGCFNGFIDAGETEKILIADVDFDNGSNCIAISAQAEYIEIFSPHEFTTGTAPHSASNP